MPLIHISDNPNRENGEAMLLATGSTVGPTFLGQPTLVTMFSPLETVNGRTNLFRVYGRFESGQVMLNMDTLSNPDLSSTLRKVEAVLMQVKLPP